MQSGRPPNGDRTDATKLTETDSKHCWHPYSSILNPSPVFSVESASGVRLRLLDGREVIDGMASWWCVIHGYNHPVLNAAARSQLDKVSHVMFGGLNHEPAIHLVRQLVDLTPEPLTKVFLADSGSVSVEVAMKMALQFWQSQGKVEKNRMLTVKHGYHGDTIGCMSVCDPHTGMHHLFSGMLPSQIFADAPPPGYNRPISDEAKQSLRIYFERHHQQLAAFIIEPIVQGAGGMRFYSPDYLRMVRQLCDEFSVLLLFDEIATGFCRTGEMFACHHAGVCPDIMTVGKALSAGYMTLAAALCTDGVAHGICQGKPGVFMHGPTFMGNPLACSVANASIDLLLSQDWRSNIRRIENGLRTGLEGLTDHSAVEDVRVLGAIGVIEMKSPVSLEVMQPRLVNEGIWLRPFGKLVYTMPPYVISDEDLAFLCTKTSKVICELYS